MTITMIGIDIAKSVFHLHATNHLGRQVKRKKLRRDQLLQFLAQVPACKIAMEACGSSHHWAREIQQLGHKVLLISPQYVTPFRLGNKNDYNDAQAIAEAASRPQMRFVAIKSIEQQSILMLHRMRERLVKQRTALVNQTRGLLAEFGVVFPQGIHHFRAAIPYLLEDGDCDLTPMARESFALLYEEFLFSDQQVKHVENQIKAISEQSSVCKKLDEIQGIGELAATALYASIGDATLFKNGRHLSAFLGLVPRHDGSGDKNILKGISKRGNGYVRTLLIHGARSVLRHSINKSDPFSLWANALRERRGFNKACVAIANKLARYAWVVMSKDENFVSLTN